MRLTCAAKMAAPQAGILAPEETRLVARGEAKRNPWSPSPQKPIRPRMGAEESSAPARDFSFYDDVNWRRRSLLQAVATAADRIDLRRRCV